MKYNLKFKSSQMSYLQDIEHWFDDNKHTYCRANAVLKNQADILSLRQSRYWKRLFDSNPYLDHIKPLTIETHDN